MLCDKDSWIWKKCFHLSYFQLKKSYYQQQDELRELRELLKGKELKIRQLEYENVNLKKGSKTVSQSKMNSSMIHEDSDCSEGSSAAASPVEENHPELIIQAS